MVGPATARRCGGASEQLVWRARPTGQGSAGSAAVPSPRQATSRCCSARPAKQREAARSDSPAAASQAEHAEARRGQSAASRPRPSASAPARQPGQRTGTARFRPGRRASTAGAAKSGGVPRRVLSSRRYRDGLNNSKQETPAVYPRPRPASLVRQCDSAVEREWPRAGGPMGREAATAPRRRSRTPTSSLG